MQSQNILKPQGGRSADSEKLVKQLNIYLHLDTRYLFTGCHFLFREEDAAWQR